MALRTGHSAGRLVSLGVPIRHWFVHSPEDILLQKLAWYQGGEVSDCQWRDALAIIIVQGSRLDRDYLGAMSTEVGVGDLLEPAYREAGGPS